MKDKLFSKDILHEVKPNQEEIHGIEEHVNEFIRSLRKKIKSSKINVDIFIGGSFAKKTLMKKAVYDVDIFLRFDKKEKDISKITEKLLKNFKKKKKIHGSRDYFNITINRSLFIEVVPVLKIKRPQEAENITDLSYFHVNYAKRKISKKLEDEIILAKAFCHAAECYGAESYINGFSGYGLELLIIYYGDFLRFVKEISKMNIKEKKVIDIEKKFKNKQEILMNLNGAKLESPIILIDPTYKQRNALAALSEETLKRFQEHCRKFLNNPGKKYFRKKEINIKRIGNNFKKRKKDFVILKISTGKQEGDIAGSKLLKFYNHLEKEMGDYFKIGKKEFVYGEGKTATLLFSSNGNKNIIFKGPKTQDKKNVAKFRKKHKKTFTKNNRIHAKYQNKDSLKEFLKNWKQKNRKKMREMYIKRFDIVQ